LALLPTLGFGCDLSERKACEQKIVDLVSYRSQAIARAFGDLAPALPGQVRVKFVTSKDPTHPLSSGAIAYDPEEHVLFMWRGITSAKVPNPLRLAANYWPFYEQEQVRKEFPVIEAIDGALWDAYLQEAARGRGLAWSAEDCRSVHIEKRLPCEMVVSAIARVVKMRRVPIFNENRIDRLWPEDFAGFANRNWRHEGSEYRDVRQSGGMLLVQPLVGEFGVPRALAYLARTPFHVEENNMRLSAQRYQDRARDALRIQGADWVAQVSSIPSHSTPQGRE
jgi:hypothetical protein